MDWSLQMIKRWYRLQQDIEALSERDRALLLFILVVVIFGVWFYIPYYFQTKSLNNTRLQVQEVVKQTTSTVQKMKQIELLSSSPDMQGLMAHHKDLNDELSVLDQRALSYTRRYISGRDLSKMLHDMLNQTSDVQIIDFSTVSQPVQAAVSNPSDASSTATAPEQKAPAEKTHYQLILKGGYFATIDYLRRLEEMSWRLYWDSIDYKVEQYPDGIATIAFYTLKPTEQSGIQQGGTQ